MTTAEGWAAILERLARLEEKLDAHRGGTLDGLAVLTERVAALEVNVGKLERWRVGVEAVRAAYGWRGALVLTVAGGMAVAVGGALALKILGV